MSFSTAAAISSLPLAGILRRRAAASLRTSGATVNWVGNSTKLIPTRKADPAYHLDASRTFEAALEANEPYDDAALDIIEQFWDRRHVLAPEKQLAIRNKGSLFLACPEPEDLATFKEACMADDPTYKYLGGRSSAWKSKRGKLIHARRFATKTDEIFAVEAPVEAMEVNVAIEDLALPTEAAEKIDNADEPQFDDDAAFLSDEGYEIATAFIDDAGNWIYAEEDHVQPTKAKANEEVGHSDADEPQFDVEETFFGDEEVAAVEDPVQPIEPTGEIGHADEPQFKPIVQFEVVEEPAVEFGAGANFDDLANGNNEAVEEPAVKAEAAEEPDVNVEFEAGANFEDDEPLAEVDEALERGLEAAVRRKQGMLKNLECSLDEVYWAAFGPRIRCSPERLLY